MYGLEKEIKSTHLASITKSDKKIGVFVGVDHPCYDDVMKIITKYKEEKNRGNKEYESNQGGN